MASTGGVTSTVPRSAAISRWTLYAACSGVLSPLGRSRKAAPLNRSVDECRVRLFVYLRVCTRGHVCVCVGSILFLSCMRETEHE